MEFRNLKDARLEVAAQEDDRSQSQPLASNNQQSVNLPLHGLPLGETMYLIPESPPPAFQILNTDLSGKAERLPTQQTPAQKIPTQQASNQQAPLNPWTQEFQVRAHLRLPQATFPAPFAHDLVQLNQTRTQDFDNGGQARYPTDLATLWHPVNQPLRHLPMGAVVPHPSQNPDIHKPAQRERRTYRPMAMVSPVLRAMQEYPTAQVIQSRIRAGVSPNYRGNHNLASNLSADIRENENCSLWIEGLEANVTVHRLLSAIRDVGRVWQCHIVVPNANHSTAAAKLTFFTAQSAITLLGKCLENGSSSRLEVGGRLVRVVYNRQRVAAPTTPENHTRVLIISGPPTIVNIPSLTAYFDSLFVYQTDEIITLVAGQAINVLEWRFGSYRCQAQAAWEALRVNPNFREHGVTVSFDRDPCDSSPLGL